MDHQPRPHVLGHDGRMRRQCKGLEALLPKKYQEVGWLYSPTSMCMQTSSNGLSFCSSHKYGSSWRSAMPPSVPSCVPALLLHRQELPLSKGKALLTRGQPHVSSAVSAPTQMSPSSAHTGSCSSGSSGAAESRMGTVAEPECGFDACGVCL